MPTENLSVEKLTQLRESVDFEAKGATDQLPMSFWESYSSFANTQGGIIALGVKQNEAGLFVKGVADPEKVRKSIFDGQSDKQQVSAAVLEDQDVTVHEVEGRKVILVSVPRARREVRPIYLGADPKVGTYVRRGESDYLLPPDQALRLLADAVQAAPDSEPLDGFSVEDFDADTISQYRRLFRLAQPDHPWGVLSDEQFLLQTGALVRNRATGKTSPSLAGLLFFGQERSILDAVPDYYPEYREKLSPGAEPRWDDRLVMDGRWPANLFTFFFDAIRRLTRDLRVPFQLEGLQRRGDTHVHEALREALVNTLAHADHRGRGGILVEKHVDGFRFSNPGLMRVDPVRAREGGASDPRNPTLHRLFGLVGLGERAGSGLPKIHRAWQEQHWRSPEFLEDTVSLRTTLEMRQVSLLPPDSIARLEERFGHRFKQLEETGVLALVLSEVDGRVTNRGLQSVTGKHPADITALLKSLVAEGFLDPHGATSGAWYTLADRPTLASPLFNPPVSPPLNPPLNPPTIPSAILATQDAVVKDPSLLAIAAPSRRSQRLPARQMERIVLELCVADWRSPSTLGDLLMRDSKSLPLRTLVQAGDLEMRHPTQPAHPGQAYRTTLQGKERLVEGR